MKTTEITLQQKVAQSDSRHFILQSSSSADKTLAYAIAILKYLKTPCGNVQALVLAPTDERVAQIADIIRSLTTEYRTIALCDENDFNTEQTSLRTIPDIVVATPRRLLAHYMLGNVVIRTVTALVFDEYDQSLQLGLHDPIHNIVTCIPSPTTVVLTSTTPVDTLPRVITRATAEIYDTTIPDTPAPPQDHHIEELLQEPVDYPTLDYPTEAPPTHIRPIGPISLIGPIAPSNPPHRGQSLPGGAHICSHIQVPRGGAQVVESAPHKNRSAFRCDHFTTGPTHHSRAEGPRPLYNRVLPSTARLGPAQNPPESTSLQRLALNHKRPSPKSINPITPSHPPHRGQSLPGGDLPITHPPPMTGCSIEKYPIYRINCVSLLTLTDLIAIL